MYFLNNLGQGSVQRTCRDCRYWVRQKKAIQVAAIQTYNLIHMDGTNVILRYLKLLTIISPVYVFNKKGNKKPTNNFTLIREVRAGKNF